MQPPITGPIQSNLLETQYIQSDNGVDILAIIGHATGMYSVPGLSPFQGLCITY